jgi:hypothetical protein
MPRALVTNDWRKLSRAARKERDPKKFVYLLKQLYNAVNEGEEKRGISLPKVNFAGSKGRA